MFLRVEHALRRVLVAHVASVAPGTLSLAIVCPGFAASQFPQFVLRLTCFVRCAIWYLSFSFSSARAAFVASAAAAAWSRSFESTVPRPSARRWSSIWCITRCFATLSPVGCCAARSRSSRRVSRRSA